MQLFVVAKCHFASIKVDSSSLNLNSHEYLAQMIAPSIAWALSKIFNRTHIYHKIMRIVVPLHQLFINSHNHGVHLK
jgi:hypothetical protein